MSLKNVKKADEEKLAGKLLEGLHGLISHSYQVQHRE